MSAQKKSRLTFLKLGGSLLGDKRKPRSFRRGVARRLAREIRAALGRSPGMRLLLAHGGAGFAHFPAKRFRTAEGISGGGGWRGFAETRRGVNELNRRLLDCFTAEGLFPVTVSPCAGVLARGGEVSQWDIRVIRGLLDQGMVPLIHGDAVMDTQIEFTIISTEQLFAFLAARLRPVRVILACDVEGVYLGKPTRAQHAEVVRVVDRANIADVRRSLGNPARKSRRPVAWDVTGGMAAKVERLYEVVALIRGLEARIVSGLRPGVVESALLGDEVGTVIRY